MATRSSRGFLCQSLCGTNDTDFFLVCRFLCSMYSLSVLLEAMRENIVSKVKREDASLACS